jgi:hypothetical protein
MQVHDDVVSQLSFSGRQYGGANCLACFKGAMRLSRIFQRKNLVRSLRILPARTKSKSSLAISNMCARGIA